MGTTADAKAILWVDLETTGGDETEDEIIEVGAILTDFEYKEIAPEFQMVCKPSDHAWSRLMANEVVKKMHTENGLIAELTRPWAHDINHVDLQLEDFVRSRIPAGKVILAGSGVGHFDRKFINVQLPNTALLLKHAPLDIGVVRRFLRYAGYTFKMDAQPTKNHRAFDDITLHLNEAREYRQFIQRAQW